MSEYPLKALTWQRADEPVHVLHTPCAGIPWQEGQREGRQVVAAAAAAAAPPLLQLLGGGGGGAGGGGRLGQRRPSVERLDRAPLG